MEAPIDKVTTNNLDTALRMCEINLPISTIDKIIDVVELLEEKGELLSIKDIHALKSEWEISCHNFQLIARPTP